MVVGNDGPGGTFRCITTSPGRVGTSTWRQSS
ncbi:LOW QUALITY PROTEIN: hypothetical protein TorRG33x02_145650 [Trema orientale]|uniref:Uncharacterized protein n=1 Tax=Trema orientale TaxID=63057 RepID=A0A2P5EVL9_TREOI|nr:LOW QUALITY PROTEIN: hypothetical protein TorRG33x02_145650 [Trema orientale]